MIGDGFVRDAGNFFLQQRVSQIRYRRQMKIGEQHQARPEVRNLLLHRLLDLHDHVGALPYHLCRANNLRSRFLIFRVWH